LIALSSSVHARTCSPGFVNPVAPIVLKTATID
jgi:hypothetical protein